MLRDNLLYENWTMPDPNFPIKLERTSILNQKGNIIFPKHWHEKIEFLYFTKGEAIIECNSSPIHAKRNDLIVINSNDLHQGFSLTDELEYCCIILEASLLQSRSVDACEAKYITPITQNNIIFKNRVGNEKNIQTLIYSIMLEFDQKQIGFELSIKSHIYNLLVLLLRNHAELIMTSKEYNSRIKNLERFNTILQYIETHYQEKLTIDALCNMINMSRFYFCRLFKQVTGKTLSEHLNYIRIEKASQLLMETSLNITEVSMQVGFDSVNYFSRLFKKYKKATPSTIKRDVS